MTSRSLSGRIGTAAIALAAVALAPVGAPASGAATGATCTILGTPRADVLVGTRRADVMCGRGGNDVIRGRGGADTLLGQKGRDTLVGGPGADLLHGGAGNDRLRGGPGHDDVFGEAGDDTCAYAAVDLLHSCAWDLTPPEILGVTISVGAVDVTSAAQQFTVRLHVRDDSAVSAVRSTLADHEVAGAELGQGSYRLVSGTPRNGWWAATEKVPRGFPAATLDLSAYVTDLHGRPASTYQTGLLTVADSAPDDKWPEVRIVSPASLTELDVRTGAASMRVEAAITDSDTGVAGSPRLCLSGWTATLGETSEIDCAEASLVQGTRRDGRWAADLGVPGGYPTGDLLISMEATDRARPRSSAHYLDPVAYVGQQVLWRPSVATLRIADGVAVHRVLGDPDDAAPVVADFTLDPGKVTWGTADTVAVTAHLTDAGPHGVASVSLVVLGPSATDLTPVTVLPLTLATGTGADGEWSVEVTGLAQHAPGDYPVLLAVGDGGHQRFFSGATLAGDLGVDLPALPGPPDSSIVHVVP
ncbi:MAG TPA: hypothetical protein PLP61_13655 [Nocardioides sp.]|uniref:calcium-binding protein n=1 Tax=Nocardioides sp. TaxID=35761 RepID=UPI002CD8CA86|nr:hypothetical protein [Nocardioides sp.]HQR28079.1 hypothetical protein [Nocardioides sp.]